MKLTMLGTGNALVTHCYNTCFVIDDGPGRRLMVDGGGGNQVLRQLELAGYGWADVHEVFVTHKHMDHLLGILWMVRMICQHMERGDYEGEATIYAHDEVCALLRECAGELLPSKIVRHLGGRLRLVEVCDGERREVMGHPVTFFDIGSTKAKQFGFAMDMDADHRLVCCGDEPFAERALPYAQDATWLLHEAFCLRSQANVFHPYEKHHSTAADAAATAERLGVQNLLLYHTEDHDLAHRRELYTAEALREFRGRVCVPDDLETIEL